MFRSFSRSWELIKTSFSILRQDKELIIFPIVSMIGLILVSIGFFVPMWLAGLFENVGAEGESVNPLLIAIVFLYYVVTYFITIFANAAVVGAAMKRMQGEDPTFSDAFNIAVSRIDKILGWAIVAATVGMILRAIESRSEGAGRLVTGLVEMAWGLATFLVVPVLVVEDIGPLGALKRSASLLRQTWGQQIVGNFGLGIIFFLIALAGIIPLGLLAAMLSTISIAAAILVGIILAIYVFIVMAIATAINGIFTAAVYAYATHTPTPAPIFEQDLLQDVFRAK